ncbi:MAG: Cdc6/Cdc18 family protein [Promethearchaeota archaeon]
MDYEEELKRSLNAATIFKSTGESTFNRDYLPEQVPHREETIRKMLLDFKVVLKEHKGVNIGVKGGGGFGKTLVTRFSQEKLQNVANDIGVDLEVRYYNCFKQRTLGAILRDYLPKQMYISGKGFSISELITFLIKNLQKDRKKLVLIIDEIQNLEEKEIMRLLTINESFKQPGSEDEFLSLIFIARDYDWHAILEKEPRIAQRLHSTYELPKYTHEQLIDIFLYRRSLGFRDGVFSDENVELVTEMSESTGNVYYGIEIMHQAGKRAEYLGESEVLPEMIRGAANNVSTEFREPVLAQLRLHELYTLLGIARLLQRLNKSNITKATVRDVFEEYKVVCEERSSEPHVITVFRKYIKKLHQNHLIKQRVINLQTRGRRGEVNIIGFSAELVQQKVTEVLEKKKDTDL